MVVVPKGLRAFDREDCDFFLGLVPGPHDRDGLPQSLRFWRTRLEETASHPLRVGVVYGPSGCGKSSLIRAGLLPKLAISIHTIVVTATDRSTEASLLAELTPLLPQPPKNLVEALQWLRRGASIERRRVVIVFDQFEQWLHANHAAVDSELVQALRQCDGEHVACLLIVRDDFWMSVHRFFRELDIRLAEGENCAAVDLFDTRHARRVLHAFGHAYEALPERGHELSAEQNTFLDQAIAELAENDRVICVRLALFAQMVRNRPWIPATLAAIGGARGVGIRFLEDTFGPTAPLAYRVHQVALREMLRALLPAPGTDIKACTQSAGELAREAKCDLRSEDFRQLLGILEEETRLLTPVDAPQPAAGELSAVSGSESRAYQLTHDYLVPSIREWLTRKQRETWRGRCELRLEERASLWSARQERKQLPSLWETTQITLGTKSANWTSPQVRMMRRAQRSHGQRLLAVVLLVACLLIGGAVLHRNNQQALRQRMADATVDQLLVAEIGRVIPVLRELEPTRDVWSERLLRLVHQDGVKPADKLRAELALMLRDGSRVGRLLELIGDADPDTMRVVRDWLKEAAPPTPLELWSVAKSDERSGSSLPIAVLLAEFDPSRNDAWPELSRDVATSLVTDSEFESGAWAELLMPIRERVAAELSAQFWKPSTSSSQRFQTAQLLARLASTQTLCRVIVDAEAVEFSVLMRPLSHDGDAAVEPLKALLDAPLADCIESRLQQVDRRRNAAVALMLLEHADLIWPLLGTSANGTLRTQLMLTMRSFGVPLETLLSGEESVRDPIVRQAIWQSLADGESAPSEHDRQLLSERILARWPHVTDQAERAGIQWLAQRCGLSDALRAAAPKTPPTGSNWSVNSQGQEFVEIRGPVEFVMGSPEGEPRRDSNERQHRRRIDRSFTVGVHEVTAEQFHRFQPTHAMDPNVCVTPDCPASFLSWLDGAKYCRWLSEQEGVPNSQMCYPPLDQIRLEMSLPSDQLSRTGYRMPTEAEWEYFCRGGTATRYFFGEDDRHVSEFGWWLGNSLERTWPVGLKRPNSVGLFDVEGNIHEWCQDVFDVYPNSGQPTVAVTDEVQVSGGSARVFRGAMYRSAVRPVRVAFRYRNSGDTGFSGTGLRVVRTIATR